MTVLEGHILITRAKKNGSDGRSITAVIKYYLATSANSGITIATTGWSTTVQTIDATSKYLWTYEKITYSDGSYTTTDPVITGTAGTNGYNGCNMRPSIGLTVGQTYHNDWNDATVTGVRYLDIVLIADSSIDSGYAAYECVQTYTAATTTDYTDTTKWTKLASNFADIYLGKLIAANAYIKLLASNTLAMYDDKSILKCTLNADGNGDIIQYYPDGKIRFKIDSGTIAFYNDDAENTVDSYLAIGGKIVSTIPDSWRSTELAVWNESPKGSLTPNAITGSKYSVFNAGSNSSYKSYNGFTAATSGVQALTPVGVTAIPDGFYTSVGMAMSSVTMNDEDATQYFRVKVHYLNGYIVGTQTIYFNAQGIIQTPSAFE